jgi:hypothetical protein
MGMAGAVSYVQVQWTMMAGSSYVGQPTSKYLPHNSPGSGTFRFSWFRSGMCFPQLPMFQDLLDYIRIIAETDDFHLMVAPRTT